MSIKHIRDTQDLSDARKELNRLKYMIENYKNREISAVNTFDELIPDELVALLDRITGNIKDMYGVGDNSVTIMTSNGETDIKFKVR